MPRVQPMSGTDGVDIVVVERLPLFEILNNKQRSPENATFQLQR